MYNLSIMRKMSCQTDCILKVASSPHDPVLVVASVGVNYSSKVVRSIRSIVVKTQVIEVIIRMQ